MTARARISLTVKGLTTGLNVFSKSIPCCWWKPLATSLALYRDILPSLFLFSLKNPFTANYVLAKRWRIQRRCLLSLKSRILFSHSTAPLGNFGSCLVSWWLCLCIVNCGSMKGLGFEDSIFRSSMHRMCIDWYRWNNKDRLNM